MERLKMPKDTIKDRENLIGTLLYAMAVLYNKSAEYMGKQRRNQTDA